MTAETFDLIIQAEELFRHLHDPDYVIVDCRTNLSDPGWGQKDYTLNHILGAVYADLNLDLSGPRTALTGRHPIPSKEQMEAVFSRLGINSASQVVVYDTTSGSFAGRCWFLLKYCGHEKVALLDGGFNHWRDRGYPTETGTNVNAAREFVAELHSDMLVTTSQVENLRLDPHWRLIDARAPERYAGISEPIDPVAGHIHGALNRFHELNLTAEGVFKSPSHLKEEFSPLLLPDAPENTILYCGSGVTSIHDLIAMKLAGLPTPRLYAGSWSEWIRDPKHPITAEKKEPAPKDE